MDKLLCFEFQDVLLWTKILGEMEGKSQYFYS